MFRWTRAAARHRVALAFLGRTVGNPRLAQAHGETGRLIRSMLATAGHHGQKCGEAPDDTDEVLAALTLVTARVQAVFPGRCRQYDQPKKGRASHDAHP